MHVFCRIEPGGSATVKPLRLFLCAAIFLPASANARPEITATTDLTPGQITDGQLPDGYRLIFFNISEGDWGRFIKLPQSPSNGDRVLFSSSARLKTYVLGDALDAPLKDVNTHACGYCTLRFSKSTGRWSVSGTKVKYYASDRRGIPAGSWNIAFYDIKNDSLHDRITLPDSAKDGDVIFIRSASPHVSGIDPANLLYASSAAINAGDAYTLRYIAERKKWGIEDAPLREIAPNSTGTTLTSPRSLILLTDDNWIPTISLPRNANDRDRIVVRSATSHTALIDAAGIKPAGTLGLAQGQEYSFLYLAGSKRWELVDAPDTIYTSRQLQQDTLPVPATPRAIYVADRKSYAADIYLPATAARGTRIVFKGETALPFDVHFGSSRHTVRVGENPSFIRKGNAWALETVTVDLLALYSDKAAAEYGEDFMRTRLLDGVLNTNDALENSGANFRLNLVSTQQIKAGSGWSSLDGPYNDLNTSFEVAGLRDRFKADLVYYEGTEERTASTGDACGAAPRGIAPDHPVAVASIHCGSTKVMRHEIGHLMTLAHPGDGETFGNQGYPLADTIMNFTGGSRPFYSTPARYTRDFGMPMGVRNRYDAVDSLNAVSATVARYR